MIPIESFDLQADQFLSLLWPEVPEAERILIWTLPDKLSSWARTAQEAAKFADNARNGMDVYVGCGLQRAGLSAVMRGKMDEVTSIAGLWADIDIDGAGHKKKVYPPTAEDALALLGKMPLPASIIVHSGGGLQAYWLLKEIWSFEDDHERKRAAELVQAWQGVLKAHGEAFGWAVDSVHDLTRVLRVPGTWNRKIKGEPRECRMLSIGDARYDPSDFSEHVGRGLLPAGLAVRDEPAKHVDEKTPEALPGDGFVVRPGAAQPEKFLELAVGNIHAFLSWEHKRDFKDQSTSSYDFSLATLAANAGWIDQEIVDLLVAHRRKWPGDESGKINRTDYYRKTLSKVREDVKAGKKEKDIVATASAAEADAGGKTGVLAYLRNMIGVPLVKVIKRGRTKATYSLILEGHDGEVHIGSAATILSPDMFRSRLYEAMGVTLPEVKRFVWMEVAQRLTDVTEFVEMSESERTAQIRAWIGDYLEGSTVYEEKNWQAALVGGEPFMREGRLHISLVGLRRFVKFADERIDSAELGAMLSEAGWVNAAHTGRHNGKVYGKRYWSIPRDDTGHDSEPDDQKALPCIGGSAQKK